MILVGQILFWFYQFRKLDTNKLDHRHHLIDSFLDYSQESRHKKVKKLMKKRFHLCRDSIYAGIDIIQTILSLYIYRIPANSSDYVALIENAYRTDGSIRKQAISYGYDTQGRLTRVADAVSNSSIEYAHNNTGTVATKISKSGTTEVLRQEYDYNLAGLTTAIRYYKNGTLIKTETCDYSLDGNVIGKALDSKAIAYTYDDMGRLLTETEAQNGNAVRSDSYTFDDRGNRAQKVSVAANQNIRTNYTYDAANKLLTETEAALTNGSYVTGDTKAYTYDDAGNLSTVKVNNVLKTEYAYDSLNRMSGATLYTLSKMPSIVNPDASLTYQVQSQSTEFAYNAEAQRIGKTVSVTSTVNGQTQTDTASLRHYNNGTAIVADGVTRGTTTELNSYIFGKESEPGYAQFEALYDGTTLYFAEVDSHTDITELVGANGQTASYSYDAYGNATSAISGGVYNPYRYTSQYLDEETGLYYLRARYYDPSNGRFTQEDSYLGEENSPLTLNLYMYCHGNPIRYTDLKGHWVTAIGVAFGVAVVVGVSASASLIFDGKGNVGILICLYLPVFGVMSRGFGAFIGFFWKYNTVQQYTNAVMNTHSFAYCYGVDIVHDYPNYPRDFKARVVGIQITGPNNKAVAYTPNSIWAKYFPIIDKSKSTAKARNTALTTMRKIKVKYYVKRKYRK